MWLYRRMKKISWIQTLTNGALKKLNAEKEIVSTIQNEYLGHFLRHLEYNLLQLQIQRKIEGKKAKGHKRNTKTWTGENGPFIRREKDVHMHGGRRIPLRWYRGGYAVLSLVIIQAYEDYVLIVLTVLDDSPCV